MFGKLFHKKENEPLKVTEFRIGGTDFGVDHSKAEFAVTKGSVLNIDVHGDPCTYDAITEDEDSKWSWTLYPPHLYVHDFPINPGSNGQIKAKVSLNDLDQYEAALYLMEHNDIDNITIRGIVGSELEISGRVIIMGEELPLSIKWKIAEPVN